MTTEGDGRTVDVTDFTVCDGKDTHLEETWKGLYTYFAEKRRKGPRVPCYLVNGTTTDENTVHVESVPVKEEKHRSIGSSPSTIRKSQTTMYNYPK